MRRQCAERDNATCARPEEETYLRKIFTNSTDNNNNNNRVKPTTRNCARIRSHKFAYLLPCRPLFYADYAKCRDRTIRSEGSENGQNSRNRTTQGHTSAIGKQARSFPAQSITHLSPRELVCTRVFMIIEKLCLFPKAGCGFIATIHLSSITSEGERAHAHPSERPSVDAYTPWAYFIPICLPNLN